MSVNVPKQLDLSKRTRLHLDVQTQEQQDKWKQGTETPQEGATARGTSPQEAMKKLQQLKKAQAVRQVKKVEKVKASQEVDEVDGVSSLRGVSSAENPSPTKDLALFCKPDAMDPRWFSLDNFKHTCISIRQELDKLPEGEFRDKIISRAEKLLGEEIQARSLLESYKNALVMV